MKTITTQKQLLVAFLFFIFHFSFFTLHSQNVAINNTGASPNPSAMLDISSASGGLLSPRMTSTQMNAIANPAKGLMVIDTTTNCIMYYSGSSWQSVFCACTTAPGTPGTITGSSSFCSGASGIMYSIAAIFGANSYTWNIPAGATITAGQGTPAITVTFGSASGNISATATNNCGTSAASTLPVTLITAPAITGQPTSPSAVCVGAGSSSFTVTATGTGLTYQWQEYVSSWNNITNGGVYSGATTPTLTITNPSLSMSGNKYQCIVSGTCSLSTTSNGLATLTVHTPYVPITLTNSQSSPTGANFQQMITVNSSAFNAYENSTLQNIEFTTGPGGTGNTLQAWIESDASSGSGSTVYWVNLGSSTIAANGGTLTIYMDFMPTNIMSASGPTGEAPQLSGNYGQYDNGASVFSFYDNFAGTSLSSKWQTETSSPYSAAINNKLTVVSVGGYYIIYSTSTFSTNNVVETYFSSSGGGGGGFENASPGISTAVQPVSTYIDPYDATSSMANWEWGDHYEGGDWATCQGNTSGETYSVTSQSSGETNSIFGIAYLSGNIVYYWNNYQLYGNSNTNYPTGNVYVMLGIGGGSNVTFTYQWRVSEPTPLMGQYQVLALARKHVREIIRN